MKKILLLITLLHFFITKTYSQAQSSIFEINKKLGKGVNMGNMFEAPSEGEWGNPFKNEYFKKIASMGFNHVRVPIKWDVPARAEQTAPYVINKVFLERIKFVVDQALAENLYVIINMHHHDEIFVSPEKVKPRFLSQWTQIADYFKGYDSRLLFEPMNEPHDALTPEVWNVFFDEALQNIRKTNPKRAVLIGPGNYNSISNLAKLKVPKDENLIVSLHYYDPFSFTHQGAEWIGGDANSWLGTKWENTNLERNEIINQFDYAIKFSKQYNIPVHIGEFGAYSKADLQSRVKWSNFLARYFEKESFSWAYWEFSAGFGVYNPSNNQVLTPLADALLTKPMADAIIVKTNKLYESNFSVGDNSWVLSVQPQATASFNISGGAAVVEVKQASNQSWHVQFIKSNIALKKDKRYLVSFEAKAEKDVSVTNYIGKAVDPYNAYSGYKSFAITPDFTTFTYTFTMTSPDDSKGRIIFDLGSSLAKINFKNIKVEEIVFEPTEPTIVLANPSRIVEIMVYPNPSNETLVLKNIEKYQEVTVVNNAGKRVMNQKLQGKSEQEISIKHLAAGQYIVKIQNNNEIISKKIIKL